MTIQVCWNQPRKFQNIVVHLARVYIIVIFCLHWNLSEMLSLGILCHCSLWSNKRYLQWESMDERYETISECSSCNLITIFCHLDEKTSDGIEQYSKQLLYIQLLHTRWTISSCQHSWFTSLGPQSVKVKSNCNS